MKYFKEIILFILGFYLFVLPAEARRIKTYAEQWNQLKQVKEYGIIRPEQASELDIWINGSADSRGYDRVIGLLLNPSRITLSTIESGYNDEENRYPIGLRMELDGYETPKHSYEEDWGWLLIPMSRNIRYARDSAVLAQAIASLEPSYPTIHGWNGRNDTNIPDYMEILTTQFSDDELQQLLQSIYLENIIFSDDVSLLNIVQEKEVGGYVQGKRVVSLAAIQNSVLFITNLEDLEINWRRRPGTYLAPIRGEVDVTGVAPDKIQYIIAPSNVAPIVRQVFSDTEGIEIIEVVFEKAEDWVHYFNAIKGIISEQEDGTRLWGHIMRLPIPK